MSFVLDLPTGATIVATFGAALLALAGLRAIVRRRNGNGDRAAEEEARPN